jgi:hypothetical protein
MLNERNTPAVLTDIRAQGDFRAEADSSNFGIERIGGYQMIKSFKAENFRSFRSLKLDALPAVNILVGRSAAG